MVLEIYVAGRFREYKKVRAVIDEVEAIGHNITHDWTRSTEFDDRGEPLVPVVGSAESLTPLDAKKYAVDDREGVRQADVVILLADDEGIYGALIEAGMAIAWNVEVWVVNPVRSSVFWYLHECRIFKNIADVYEELDKFNKTLPNL